MPENPPRPRSERLVSLGLFLLSAAILLLEVGQVRIFSFILWHHVTYLVVTVTLLGFAAGGTCAALFKCIDPLARAARAGVAFAVLSVAVFVLLAHHRIALLTSTSGQNPALKAAFAYLYLVVPFLFGGLAVAAALDGEGRAVSRRYGVNMIGSALGAILSLVVLPHVGGGGLVLVTGLLAAAGAACFASAAGRSRLAALSCVAALACGAALPVADSVFPFQVAPGKALATDLARGDKLLETRWDPICRVDVIGDEQNGDGLHVTQDGDAPTVILAEKARARHVESLSQYILGYAIAPGARKNVLVIGVGGGQDVATAVSMGATHVVGAEINASTAELITKRFDRYSGGLMTDDRVKLELKDGRSLVARTHEKFDVIQLTGADTYAALAAGANLVAESYLYTMEAMRDDLDHLNDEGVLCVLRWRFDPPREDLRLFGMAARALVERGVTDPAAHLAVISVKVKSDPLAGGPPIDAAYSVTLVKKTAFAAKEIQTLRQFCTQRQDKDRFTLTFVKGGENEKPFQDFVAAVAAGDSAASAFEDAYPYAIDPVTDDRPFFFQYYRGRDVVGDPSQSQPHFLSVVGGGPAGLQVLWYSLVGSILLVVVLVILPLVVFKRGGLRVEGAGRQVVYFTAVGLAYLAVEIVTLQRLTLYLGHPLKALGAGLLAFLVFSGIGASVSARVEPGRERRGAALACCVVVLLLAAHALLVPMIYRATLAQSDDARLAIAIVLLAPVAFAMGFPFPLALRRARAAAPALLPCAFGVNGAASTVASAAAILCAMDLGFSRVLAGAAALYLLAAVALPRVTNSAGTALPAR